MYSFSSPVSASTDCDRVRDYRRGRRSYPASCSVILVILASSAHSFPSVISISAGLTSAVIRPHALVEVVDYTQKNTRASEYQQDNGQGVMMISAASHLPVKANGAIAAVLLKSADHLKGTYSSRPLFPTGVKGFYAPADRISGI